MNVYSIAERRGWRDYVDKHKECVHIPDISIKADYLYFLSDDSMEGERKPIIERDSNCFINRAAPFENGCVVAALIDGRVHVRYFEFADRAVVLRPNNPKYDFMVFDWEDLNNKVYILGRVVEIQHHVQ